MAKKPPDFMKRFKAVLKEEERKIKDAKRMKEHARKASELYAEGKVTAADRELRKAEKLKGPSS